MAASYDRGVKDTEVRLVEEVATVCREYITLSWGVALDRAAVPADSDLRKTENIFFPEDVREIPDEAATEGAQLAVKDKLPEDNLSIREVVAQAKEIASETQAADDQPALTQGS